MTGVLAIEFPTRVDQRPGPSSRKYPEGNIVYVSGGHATVDDERNGEVPDHRLSAEPDRMGALRGSPGCDGPPILAEVWSAPLPEPALRSAIWAFDNHVHFKYRLYCWSAVAAFGNGLGDYVCRTFNGRRTLGAAAR